jgi:hypothetical protein
MIIPVNTGATGIVTKGLHKNVEAISAKQQIDSLQKTPRPILQTTHIIRKVLQSEP